MKEIHVIVAVDELGGIGFENQLLFHLKKDMEFFREKTLHNIVIMGRRTMESLPGQRPLPERTNIVLTRQTMDSERGFIVAGSLEMARELAEQREGSVYVIGGARVYREFLPLASFVYVTRVQKQKKADAYFPELRREDGWQRSFVSERMRENDVAFYFETYERKTMI